MTHAMQEFTNKILADSDLSERFVDALLPQIQTIFTDVPYEERAGLLDLVEELVDYQRQNEVALRPFLGKKKSRRHRPVVDIFDEKETVLAKEVAV